MLVYEDNSGTPVPIIAPEIALNTSSFSFTNPGLPAGTHTVSVKDPLTGTVSVSGVFTVLSVVSITANAVTGAVAGAPFTFSGTLEGFSVAPALTYSLNGGTPATLPGVTLAGWSASLTVATAGDYAISVTNGAVTSNTVFFVVAPVTVNHVITPAVPSGVTAGANFTFTGTLSGYSAPPSLTYKIGTSAAVAMTGVTLTGWSMVIPAPAAGSYTVVVSDGTTSAPFTLVVASAAHVIIPTMPMNVIAGTPFTFTGVLNGYTSAPGLTYALNGGNKVIMAGVSATGWATTVTIPTAGNYTVVVSDGVTSSAPLAFTASTQPVVLRNWYDNPGEDGSFWVQPFQSSATWITSGPLVTAMRNGSNASPTGSINLLGNYAATFYAGKSTDPLVTVTNGSHSITVHIPLGAIVETPPSQYDQSIGGLDETQPYLVWSISGATINTGAVAASGSVITGTYGMCVMDGSGLMMVDAVTGNAGNANAFGGITIYDLAQFSANPAYFPQHMLAYQMDPSSQVSSAGPIWPLAVVDNSSTNSGPIPQGVTIGIPASTPNPGGLTSAQNFWFNQLQQFGAFFYNVSGAGCVNFFCADYTGLYTTQVNALNAALSSIMPYVCILNYQTGLAGAQYSLATTKGAVAGSTNAFPAPAPLDLTPTGGVNVLPSTFGAWYPSGYNVAPTNGQNTPTPPPPPMLTITPTQPGGVTVNTPFSFEGSLSGYTTIPTLTYRLNVGPAQALGGVTLTGWSTTITSTIVGLNTISVTDGNGTTGSTSFTVSTASGSGPNRVVAPLTGSVTTGTWSGNLLLTSFKNGPSDQPMNYVLLLPAQYNSGVVYPLVVYGHTNDSGMEGNNYPNNADGFINGNSLTTLSINQVFNTVAWRTAYPSIVCAPMCDQSLDTSGANGNANFGGYDDTPNSGWNEQAVVALAQFLTTQYSVDTTRMYITGTSLGGIGTLAQLADNNVYGGINKIWTAGWSLSDQLFRPNVNGGSNSAVISALQGVPLFTIPTSSDNDPNSYDFPAWTQYTGNSNYPGPGNYASGGMPACRAGTTQYYMLNDGGDTPWSTYYQTNADGGQGSTAWTWLFSQISGGSTAPTITGAKFTPAASVVANSPKNTVAGGLSATSTSGALTGITFTLNATTNFAVSGTNLVFNSAIVAMGTYPLTVTVKATNASNSPQSYPISVVVTPASGVTNFSVQGGKIFAPNGSVYIAKGVNTLGPALTTVVANAPGLFPGLNHYRVPVYPTNPGTAQAVYPAPSTYISAIETATGYTYTGSGWVATAPTGVVIEIEDHNQNDNNYSALSPYTGAALTVQLNWYAAMATLAIGNPYFWLGGPNEINSSDGTYSQSAIAAISTWESQIYNAIRATGNNNMIQFMAGVGGSNIGTVGAGGGFTSSLYAPMTNICWEIHCYYSAGDSFGSPSIYTTAQGYVNGGTSAPSSGAGGGWGIIGAQTITSADGVVPVIIGEWGSDSGNPNTTEAANIAAAVAAVQGAPYYVGSTAWTYWQVDNTAWALVGSAGGLTTYGTEVANSVIG